MVTITIMVVMNIAAASPLAITMTSELPPSTQVETYALHDKLDVFKKHCYPTPIYVHIPWEVDSSSVVLGILVPEVVIA